ncbi:hypothetical protein BH23ACT10_BH23ACT10_20710 [soil metagenome]
MHVRTSSRAFRQACADPTLRREHYGDAAASFRLLVGLLVACPTLEAVADQPPVSVVTSPDSDDLVIGLDGAGGRVELIATVNIRSAPEIVVRAMRVTERSVK